MSDGAFASYLEARRGDAAVVLHEDDLRVCFEALRGTEAALRELQSVHFAGVDPHLRKLGLDAGEVDDVKQRLLRTLLVETDEAPPRLAQYDGRGPLRAWLRVSAVREGLKVLRKKKREISVGDDADMLEDKVSPGDPELAYMKSMYRDVFREAFRDAVLNLDARQRTLLRQSLIDGLSIDDLARLYGAHRATTARWIASARETVVTETRNSFMERIKVSADECDSVFRMISSHLDVTLRRHLG
jgi:RNA polymerase sigma-70 factor, ECF subfamily